MPEVLHTNGASILPRYPFLDFVSSYFTEVREALKCARKNIYFLILDLYGSQWRTKMGKNAGTWERKGRNKRTD